MKSIQDSDSIFQWISYALPRGIRSLFFITLCLTWALIPYAHAESPTLSFGLQCSSYSFWDAPQYDPNSQLGGCGLTGELAVFERSMGEGHHLQLHLGWRQLDQEVDFFDGRMSLQRDTVDVGVSYRYELWSWLHPYLLVSGGLAFDSLNLEFGDESLVARQYGLFHATTQVGVETTLEIGQKSQTAVGFRLLYALEYTSQDDFIAQPVAPLPPNSRGVALGRLGQLGEAVNFIAFIRF